MVSDSAETASRLDALAASIRESHPDATVALHDDDTEMTPMMRIQVADAGERASILRVLFGQEDDDLRVTAVHDHQIVVRE